MALKSKFQIWGLVLILVLSLLAACGEENTPVPAATTRPAPAYTTAPAITGGLGSELNGQMFAVGEADVRVSRVELYDELKSGLTSLKPGKGVFMVVALEVANLNKKPVSLGDINLADSKNQEYSPLSFVSSEQSVLQTNFGYYQEIYTNPGLVSIRYRSYDIPREAAGLKLVFKSSAARSTTRQPSAESFKVGPKTDSGAGQELAGKTTSAKFQTGTADIKVTKVDRLGEVEGPLGTIKSNGVYLVLTLEIKNNTSKEVCCETPVLKDSEGRLYQSGSLSVIAALHDKYKSSLAIKAGETGPDYAVYEVVKDARGFELLEPAKL